MLENIIFIGEIPTYGLAGNRQDVVDVKELKEPETLKAEVEEESDVDNIPTEYVSLFTKSAVYIFKILAIAIIYFVLIASYFFH